MTLLLCSSYVEYFPKTDYPNLFLDHLYKGNSKLICEILFDIRCLKRKTGMDIKRSIVFFLHPLIFNSIGQRKKTKEKKIQINIIYTKRVILLLLWKIQT